MTIGNRVFKGAVILGSGQAFSYGCSFVRNVIVARVLTQADFGIAAAFAITVSMLETASNLSLDRLLVQSKDGEAPSFQATIQLVWTFRGLVNAAFVFALAWPIPHFFGIPEARWAFQWLAVIPLVRGFMHQDINRLQRRMKFAPVVIVEAIPQAIVVLAAWPVTVWLGDYSAVLWLLVAKTCLTVIVSHALAERRFTWAWRMDYIRQVINFSWPLLLNGLLLLGIMHGDRLILGAAYTMEDLAVYSVAGMLALTAWTFIMRIYCWIMLPLMSRVQQSSEEFNQLYTLCNQGLSVISSLFAGTFIIAGAPLIILVYGEKYSAAGSLIGWLAAAGALRMMRCAPTIAAMAKGDTRNLMISNIARSSGLGMVFIVAAMGSSLVWFAICAVAGEVLALLVSTSRLSYRHQLPIGPSLLSACFFSVMMVLAFLVPARLMQTELVAALGAAFVFALLTILGAASLFRNLRQEVCLTVSNWVHEPDAVEPHLP